MDTNYDVAVVGAGSAGLQAALTLGRMRRRVVVFGTDRYRNDPATEMHNFLGHDGTPPAELRTAARADLERYPTVELREQAVTHIEGEAGAFTLRTSDGSVVTARRVLLATGVADTLPDIPGLDALGATVSPTVPTATASSSRAPRSASSEPTPACRCVRPCSTGSRATSSSSPTAPTSTRTSPAHSSGWTSTYGPSPGGCQPRPARDQRRACRRPAGRARRPVRPPGLGAGRSVRGAARPRPVTDGRDPRRRVRPRRPARRLCGRRHRPDAGNAHAHDVRPRGGGRRPAGRSRLRPRARCC